MAHKSRLKQIEKASWLGIIGNSLISGVKLYAGLITGSLAVLADGIDSTTDIVTSIITLVTAKIASKPPDIEHPYGHSRAETVATKLLSFIITFAGFQLLISTINKIITGESSATIGKIAFIATLISLGGKIFLAVYKSSIGKRVKSQMLIADAKNMRNDILISSMVLISLLISLFTKTIIIDRVMAIGISLFIIKTGVSIFFETTFELMDGMRDMAIYRDVFKAVESVKSASNPHRVRIRKMNNQFIVDLDVEVDPNITVEAGHSISIEVEEAIREINSDIYDVIVHIEPWNSLEPNEKFGVKKVDINTN